MPTLELLDSSRHARLRVRAVAESPSHFAQVFPAEFATAAARCPVLFTKDPQTGNFYAGAMMGFKAGENLLTSSGAGDGFVPLASRRGGFFTSGQQIAIDREHVRFSESEGDRLFDDAGQPADPLRAVQRVLGEIHAGLEQTRAYIAALTASNLIEAIDVSLQFDDGERISLQGLYTVSLDRLRDLDDARVLPLFRAGHLQLAYTMAASLKQIARLAGVRNARGRAG